LVEKKDQGMTEQKILKNIKVLENQVLITQCTRLKGAWLDKLRDLAKILVDLKK
jgi:Zn-finger nucleic acid-binding protein